MPLDFHWDPSCPPIATIHRHLCGAPEQWPMPGREELSPIQRRRAHERWRARLRATYASVHQASAIHRTLLNHHLPLDIQSAQTYVLSELNRHLALQGHLIDSLGGPTHIEGPSPLMPADRLPGLTYQLASLYGFNLALTLPLYEAIATVADHRAIREIANMLAESTEELLALGKLLLTWLHRHPCTDDAPLSPVDLGDLMATHEACIGANPELLDRLAGTELALSQRRDNPGILTPLEEATIFYATLSDSIFPLFEHLGFAPLEHFHARRGDRQKGSQYPAIIAATGIHTSSLPTRH